MISLEDLPKLLAFDVTWYATYNPIINDFYARCTQYLGTFEGKPKYKLWYLHKFIMDAEKRDNVDHLKQNTLDNRRDMLKVKTYQENLMNRKGANKNNKTGVRNVCWIEADRKYIVQMQIERKNTRLGAFDSLEEAEKFAIEMRKKYYK